MPIQPRVFHNHSRHQLCILHTDLPLDVLAFSGAEGLSQTFRYTIEFTSRLPDIDPEQLLLKPASFSLRAPAWQYTEVSYLDLKPLPMAPLRTLYGVITEFKRLSGSRDESRYEVTLEPRLALLERGKQCRLYQHQSVPEIVESILRSRHGFRGEDFYFDVLREYPRRVQVMQYDESDLAFITRLLADIGLWFRFTHDDRLQIEVVEFHDDQRRYQFGIELPLTPPSGLTNTGADHVWDLQTRHRVVEKHMNIRAYDPQQARAWMQGEVDQTLGSPITYGEAYHYAEPYTVLGDRYDQDEHLQSESGFFYARLRHERYLNGRVGVSGASTSATLVPGQVLKVKGAPSVFDDGVVITSLQTRAARDSSFVIAFQGMPFYERICFRPPALPKPVMVGTLPARITSPVANNIYGELNPDGHYTVQFLFDRDTWQLGRESKLLRLARPYAGDTYGLHFPLVTGTEVAIAFEQGDPDRPYIAHALHDSEHPDPVAMRNDRRNVLRTPANNKLRMGDHRGQEHIKLSTEHSGKSQLNLGHLVDAKKQKRGEGFELRSDGHGALRAGSGLFISADGQPKADGPMLDMDLALHRLKQAAEQMKGLSADAKAANADPAAVHEQFALLREELDQLKASVALLSAPRGIALTSGKHLQLAAQENLIFNAGADADMSVMKRLFMGIGQGLSVFVNKLGIKLIANQGPVTVQAQNDTLQLLARQGLEITSSEDEIRITAKKKIVLNANGSYLYLDRYRIEASTEGDLRIKAPYFDYFKTKAREAPAMPEVPAPINPPLKYSQQYHIFEHCGEKIMPGVRYTITAANGQQWKGVTDSQGVTERVWTAEPQKLSIVYDYEEEEEEEELVEGITLRLGLFFDGTGNNAMNSALTEQCRREDNKNFSPEELKAIIEYCESYGFDGFDGEGFGSAPDNSYGNAASNIAALRDLYPDHASDGLPPEAQIGYIKVYQAGIGTSSHGDDSAYGLATGLGETGVVARVEQMPDLILIQLKFFQQMNPGTVIRKIELDIFGFSRGAAAARHCANELIKSDCGLFGNLLGSGRYGLVPDLDLEQDVTINFIGLFDTVAGIGDLWRGDFSVGDANNPGVNLYLPQDCARKVVSLRARDEYRANFSLNSAVPGHEEIMLPGVHSNLGGGYPPKSQERLLLNKPVHVRVMHGTDVKSSEEWKRLETQAARLHASGLAGRGSIQVKSLPIIAPSPSLMQGSFLLVLALDRPMRGDLSRVALRVMRELSVRHGVPFEAIDDEERYFKLPEELQPIAATVLEQALSGTPLELGTEEELLRGCYIHQSAHWNTTSGIAVNKPAEFDQRVVHPHKPQSGYPQ